MVELSECGGWRWEVHVQQCPPLPRSRRCLGGESERWATASCCLVVWRGQGRLGRWCRKRREEVGKDADPTPPATGDKSKLCWAPDLNVLVGRPDRPHSGWKAAWTLESCGAGRPGGQLELRVGLGASLAWGALCPGLSSSWMTL